MDSHKQRNQTETKNLRLILTIKSNHHLDFAKKEMPYLLLSRSSKNALTLCQNVG
jgi:hypothetical protein